MHRSGVNRAWALAITYESHGREYGICAVDSTEACRADDSNFVEVDSL
jgi:hypothetical protein